ncbi:MAG TPA: hypothetical protein VHZ78_08865 [Rhizomicrobium sp.]|jgi:predicted DNA-binding transcriptional regulator AlpA|nr:hypothetical protein [Rhizomicrobium sp.]
MSRTRGSEIEPRGLRRENAARYLGISPSKFDEFVGDGRLPGPKQLDGCVVWDRHRLDDAFEAFPDRDAAPAVNRWSNVAA